MLHLDHTIIPSHSQDEMATFIARMLGVKYDGRWNRFSPVHIDDHLSLDFATTVSTVSDAAAAGDLLFDVGGGERLPLDVLVVRDNGDHRGEGQRPFALFIEGFFDAADPDNAVEAAQALEMEVLTPYLGFQI